MGLYKMEFVLVYGWFSDPEYLCAKSLQYKIMSRMEYLFYGDGLKVVAESNNKDFLNNFTTITI